MSTEAASPSLPVYLVLYGTVVEVFLRLIASPVPGFSRSLLDLVEWRMSWMRLTVPAGQQVSQFSVREGSSERA